ncbi:MAG: hypothetical protein OXG24_06300, partial [Gammaproteobacteria bacterium]|nr:hypothetical protein [Gammaproteobacteria bacterium]
MSLALEDPMIAVPHKRQIHRWTEIGGSLAIERVSRLLQNTPNVYVLVATNSENARNIVDELSFFGSSVPIVLFPDCETLPYDNFSPQAGIISQRLSTLSELHTLSHGAVVTSIQSLAQKIPPKDYLVSRTLKIQVGDQFGDKDRKNLLTDGGYRRVDT